MRFYKIKNLIVFSIIGIVIMFGSFAIGGIEGNAAINKQINYQGKLTDDNGVAVSNASYDIKFTIYDAASGGSCLWTARGSCGSETARSITTTSGLFSVMLGDTVAGDNAIDLDFNTDSYYLGITVASDAEMTPRKRIGAVPQAFNADKLDGVDSESFLRSDQAGTMTGALSIEDAGGVVLGKDDATNIAGFSKYWSAGATNYYTTFTAGTQTANATYTLPLAMPGSNKILQSTSAGVMSWETAAGGGDVTKVGTPVNSQIGVWTGDGTIEGAASLTYDGSNLQLTGDIGSTGTKITKGWFTDLMSVNTITGSITGNAATVTTNANFTGPITSVGNATSIAAQTGTGTTFVMNTTPTLVTPVLGAATGTSIDLGTTTLLASRALTVDTGGVFDINMGTNPGDDFTVDTSAFVVEGDTGNVGINTATPGAKLEVKVAENTEAIRITDSTNADTIGIYTGAGTPESAVTAQLGSLYTDHDSGKVYRKSSGDGTNTGWSEMAISSGGIDSAKMRQTVAQTIATGVNTKIDFGSEDYDVGGMADTSTDRFTIQKSGKYIVTASWTINNAMDAGESASVYVYKNGSTIKSAWFNSGDTDKRIYVAATDIVDLSATDYLEMYVYHNEGADQDTYVSDSPYQPMMSVIEIDGGGGGYWTESATDLYYTAGNVGIGTATPGVSLDVNKSGNNVSVFRVSASSGTQNNTIAQIKSGADSSGYNLFSIDYGASYANNALTVRGDGNVGIGTATPGAILHIEGSSDNFLKLHRDGGKIRNEFYVYSDTAGDEPQFNLGHSRGTEASQTATQVDDELGTFSFVGFTDAWLVSAAIRAYADTGFGATGSDSPGRLEFQTTPDGSGSPQTRMTILGNGNVGIGTTTPGMALDVEDDIASSYAARIFNDGNNVNRYGLAIQCGTDDSTGTNTAIKFRDGNDTFQGSITFTSGTVTYGAFTANHDVSVPEEYNENGYPYGTLMCIKSAGTNKDKSIDQSRKILYDVEACNEPYSKKVLGAYAGKYDDQDNLHQVYVLGDGHILVNNQGGDIEIGDPITTSSVEGIGMKANDSGMTVGFAQEDYIFTNQDDIKLLAVQYGLGVYSGEVGRDLTVQQSPSGQIVQIDIKSELASLGLNVNEYGVLEVDTLKAKKVIAEEFEIRDKATGEIYCTWIENGEWKREKGTCAAIFAPPLFNPEPPPADVCDADHLDLCDTQVLCESAGFCWHNDICNTEEQEIPVCVPEWSCSGWLPLPETIACGDVFSQTQTCNDLNNCGIDDGKPAEEQETTGTDAGACGTTFCDAAMNLAGERANACVEQACVNCVPTCVCADGFSDCDSDLANGCETQGICE